MWHRIIYSATEAILQQVVDDDSGKKQQSSLSYVILGHQQLSDSAKTMICVLIRIHLQSLKLIFSTQMGPDLFVWLSGATTNLYFISL